MKKLVNFIVEKRILMLILFNIFAIICVILTNKVNINYDISKYLPEDSEVRQGLDIMETEFKENSSSFNLILSVIATDSISFLIFSKLTWMFDIKIFMLL